MCSSYCLWGNNGSYHMSFTLMGIVLMNDKEVWWCLFFFEEGARFVSIDGDDDDDDVDGECRNMDLGCVFMPLCWTEDIDVVKSVRLNGLELLSKRFWYYSLNYSHMHFRRYLILWLLHNRNCYYTGKCSEWSKRTMSWWH